MITDKYGVQFSDDMKILLSCPVSTKGKYIIPDGITNIKPWAFFFSTKLKSIIIPKSVTSIGLFAFSHCNNLTNIVIKDTKYKIHEIKDSKAIAYKGFNANMQCRGYQYEEGKTFIFDDEPKLCSQGFHACLNLLDVFNYYAGRIGQDFVVHEVILEGIIDEHGYDSKVVGNKITIGKQIL